jgi:DNA-binding transcriptional regulator YiaG
MHGDANKRGDPRHDAAGAAQLRAANARERALAAREAANQATTEYARGAHRRVAELHAELALSHEDFARTLHVGGDDPEEA